MKQKQVSKLDLKKKTISLLNENEARQVQGGSIYLTAGCATDITRVLITRGCATDITRPPSIIITGP